MTYARVVTSGGMQRIELPGDIRLETDEVEIVQQGDNLVMRPSGRTYGQRLIEALERLPDDLEIPDDPPPGPVRGL